MLTIENAIEDFLAHCRYEKNLSSKTIKFYTIDLQQFLAFLRLNHQSTEISSVDKLALKAYLRGLSLWKPKTIKRKIATVRALFNYLEYEDIITVNPLRKIRIKIKEPVALPKALTINEACQIFKSAYHKMRRAGKDRYAHLESVRNTAIIEILFATGARVSEIANLKLSDIDLTSGVIHIRGKGDKERIIQICNTDTLSVLNSYILLFQHKIKQNNNALWINRSNRPLSDQSIRGLVSMLSRTALINKKVTPHVFRHTFATLLLENDVDIKYIQAMLGHSSIMTTQIYTQVNKEKQRQILKEKHPRKE
ncbi:MAG: tyrosine-type recombinase/integrase, partial [Bacteroidetes bacterium]|nr:tyrosine-type recombinase/integrase [Bacteroidota bacterium]